LGAGPAHLLVAVGTTAACSTRPPLTPTAPAFFLGGACVGPLPWAERREPELQGTWQPGVDELHRSGVSLFTRLPEFERHVRSAQPLQTGPHP
jgi:hypothetical protein